MILDWLKGLLAPMKPSTMRELTTLEHWQAALTESKARPILLFKHSTACPTSARALQQAEAFRAAHPDAPEMVMIKVIESRPVSNAIASDLGVEHRSPQLILLRNGASVWMRSHHGIQATTIAEDLAAPSA